MINSGGFRLRAPYKKDSFLIDRLVSWKKFALFIAKTYLQSWQKSCAKKIMYGARSLKPPLFIMWLQMNRKKNWMNIFQISFCKMIVYMVLFYVTESFFKLDYCNIRYISSYISYFTKFEINLAGPALHNAGQNL